MNKSEFVHFWKKFATMLDNGVPLVAALVTLAEEHKSKPFGAALLSIIDDLKSGGCFSESIEKHSEFFGTDIVQITRGGEQQGRLHEVAMVIGQRLSEDVLSLPSDESESVTAINKLLLKAVSADASDIHFDSVNTESGKREGLIRFRIDGVLEEHETVSQCDYLNLLSRLKSLASLDVSEDRIPQDGTVILEVKGEYIDLSVSVGPSSLGEGACVSITRRDKFQAILSKRELIFPDKELRDEIFEVARSPYGLIIASGPTGSGKTTSAYSLLGLHDAKKSKIMSVEGAGQLELPGVHQLQVRPSLGLTYGAALRHFMRMDPDVIFCSEVSDVETADMLLSTALSGHLVFTQLDTPDCVTTVNRLLDIGLEPYLLAGALVGVLNQRLVRRLCIHCRKSSSVELERLRELTDVEIPDDAIIYESVGCAECGNTGFKGRRPIQEFMKMVPSLQQILRRKSTRAEIDDVLKDLSFKRLFENGVGTILSGETSLAEILRVCKIDR
jgi:type II secretory ATPase GspE/PulE/Tfp pilus assembly ATPase PilB-like protein